MPLTSAKPDIVIVERRQDVRIAVRIPGHYVLVDRRNGLGEYPCHPCHAVNISPHAIALAGRHDVRVGERVIAVIDRFGKFEGSVIRLLTGGFVMTLDASEDDRDRIAATIEWVEQHKNFDVTDKRADKRIVPVNPQSLIVLADGRVEKCVILDLSASGAAISARSLPKIGSPLALATIVGRVVRHFHGGFAIQFEARQSLPHLEGKVSLDSVLSAMKAGTESSREN